MPVPLFLGGLREEFLSGDQGDCTLKFVVGGEVVAERKAESVILKQVPHFKRQLQFEEGKTKVFTIDISDFMEDVTISAKEFVEVSLLVLFDGDVELHKKFDLVSRFGIVKFREYLELPYAEVLAFDCGWSVEKAQGIREFVIHMIKNCSLNLCEQVVGQVLYLLEKDVSEMKKDRAAKVGGDAEAADAGNDEDGADKEFEFHEKWKVAYDLMVELLQGDSDSEQRGVIVLRNLLTEDFFGFTSENNRNLICLGGGALELVILGMHYDIDPWFRNISRGGEHYVDGLMAVSNNILRILLDKLEQKVQMPNDQLKSNWNLTDVLKSDSTIIGMEKYKFSRISAIAVLAISMSESIAHTLNGDDVLEKHKNILKEMQFALSSQSVGYTIAWNKSTRDLEKENEQLKKDMSEAGQSSSSQVGIKRRRVD